MDGRVFKVVRPWKRETEPNKKKKTEKGKNIFGKRAKFDVQLRVARFINKQFRQRAIYQSENAASAKYTEGQNKREFITRAHERWPRKFHVASIQIAAAAFLHTRKPARTRHQHTPG